MNGFADPVRHFFLSKRQTPVRFSLPIQLHRRRVYVFPTRQGFVFFGMLFALLFGSVNHNNNLGFILTFLLGGMAFVSIFHTYRNIAGISLVSARAKPVFAEQQVVFAIQLHAPRLPRQAVSLWFRNNKQTSFDLPSDNTVTITVPHKTGKRGILKPDILYVSTTYPLGLFRGWSKLLIDTSCMVYPKPTAGPIVADPGSENNEHEGEMGGAGVDDFAGLETYRHGDPLQHISWKTLSRGQGLYSKKFEGQLGKTIFLNPEALPGRDLEIKLSRICHMILTAEAIRIPYGLKLGTKVISPDLGGPHKRLCLRELALTGIEE